MKNYRVQMNVTVPIDLMEWIDELAKDNDVTRSAKVVELLEQLREQKTS